MADLDGASARDSASSDARALRLAAEGAVAAFRPTVGGAFSRPDHVSGASRSLGGREVARDRVTVPMHKLSTQLMDTCAPRPRP